jgi:CRISPR-associated protein Cmr1
MKSVEIKLSTLTPVYTGGIDGKSDQLHSQGVMGSLRWWYEAILRGYGVRACDPSLHGCRYNSALSLSAKQQLCLACQEFGATGYARRFRLEVLAQDAVAWVQRDLPLNIRPYGRTRGWYLNAGRVGTETLVFTGEDETVNRMLCLLGFLEKYGSLGAKPQHGYGVFKIEQVKDHQTGKTVSLPQSFNLSPQDAPPGELPDLRTFTFFRFRFSPPNPNWWTQVSGLRELRTRRDDWAILEKQATQGMIPVAPALKNQIRYGQQWPNSIEHWLFGTVRGNERLRSKLGFSWAYRVADGWEIRGWVYLPQDQTGRAFHAYPENLRQLRAALEDPQNWLRALGLEPSLSLRAEVIIEPKLTAWLPRTASDVDYFLRQVLRERIEA